MRVPRILGSGPDGFVAISGLTVVGLAIALLAPGCGIRPGQAGDALVKPGIPMRIVPPAGSAPTSAPARPRRSTTRRAAPTRSARPPSPMTAEGLLGDPAATTAEPDPVSTTAGGLTLTTTSATTTSATTTSATTTTSAATTPPTSTTEPTSTTTSGPVSRSPDTPTATTAAPPLVLH